MPQRKHRELCSGQFWSDHSIWDQFEMGLCQEERERCFVPGFKKPHVEFWFMLIDSKKFVFFESTCKDLRFGRIWKLPPILQAWETAWKNGTIGKTESTEGKGCVGWDCTRTEYLEPGGGLKVGALLQSPCALWYSCGAPLRMKARMS